MVVFAVRLRGLSIATLGFAATLRLFSQATIPNATPLPDAAALLQAASYKEEAFAKERQRYLCVYKSHNFMNRSVRLYESFYVHGHEVQRLLELNDVPLSAEARQAEDVRVNAEIKADRKKPAPPFIALAGGMSYTRDEHSWAQTVEAAILRTSAFSNERRVDYRGRPAIQIDFKGNWGSKTQSSEEPLASGMSGTIVVDEQSGALVRIGANLDKDVIDGNYLVAAHTIMFLGFDAARVSENLYVPSSWVRNRYIHGEYEDWWLQSCRVPHRGFKEKLAAFWRRIGMRQ